VVEYGSRPSTYRPEVPASRCTHRYKRGDALDEQFETVSAQSSGLSGGRQRSVCLMRVNDIEEFTSRLCGVSFLLRPSHLKVQLQPNIKSPLATPVIVSRLFVRRIAT
jgi:hypothetical protein